ncbi:MAG TPA: hypothetical protein DEQ40_19075 [Oxalobacteraceae bacterium]|jgi:hypothetical protein|nr:hypothetical protein [Oxalobacteraceae bacterium]
MPEPAAITRRGHIRRLALLLTDPDNVAILESFPAEEIAEALALLESAGILLNHAIFVTD